MRFRLCLPLLLMSLAMTLPLYAQRYQLGTVTHMEMKDCMLVHSGFLSVMANTPKETAGVCPEYTLVNDRVVYVVDGKRSGQLIPLAEEIQFRLHKNELLVRIDDEKNESRFSIKEMVLKEDWKRDQRLRETQAELRLQRERNELGKRDELLSRRSPLNGGAGGQQYLEQALR